MLARSALGLLLVASLSALACRPRTTPAAPETPSVEPAAPADASVTAAEDDHEICARYAVQLCEAAGDGSPLCTSADELALLLPTAACEAGEAQIGYTLERVTELRATCTHVVDRLCEAIGKDTETCRSIQAQTAEFPATRCKDLADDYDSVLAEVQAIETAKQPLSPELAQEIATGDVPAFGPKDAKVTVVEFSDFQCPYCARTAEVVDRVREEYGDRIRFVFRQFPLSFHKEAHTAAQAALAAHAQGKFWAYHDILFEHQGALAPEDLKKYAKEAGLKMAKFDRALRDKTHAAEVDRDVELGVKVAVKGTPTLFVNGVRVENAVDYTAVAQAIDAALAQ